MNSQAHSARREDLQQELITLLQSVLLVEEKYGANYLMRLLRGERKYLNISAGHTQLPVFGAFRSHTFDRIRQLIRYAIQRDWICITHPLFGFLGLTESGKAFLMQPESVPVRKGRLRSTLLEKMLSISLRQLRFELARAEALPPYRIYTDQTLQALVKHRPSDLETLQQVPGMGDFHCNRYGATILMCIERVLRQYEHKLAEHTLKRAAQPAQQEVQALFESGFELEEIATKRKVKETTVIRSLENLHRARKLNLQEWVEENVDQQTLHSAGQWFQANRHAPLREAYEALGLDYETLRLCRLYVDKLHQEEINVRWAEAS